MDDSRIWYAAYGSNLSATRFGYYLCGGTPPGASRTYPGARDPRPATDVRALRVPGQVFFGWESPTWGGGIAFLDIEAAGEAYAVAYRITRQQFSDVVAQEMHRAPGADLDVDELIAARRLVLGPGRYETLVVIADVGAEPVVTFTSPVEGRPSLNAPSPAYLAMISAGLREAHQLTDAEIATYLDGLPGRYA